MNRFFSSLFAAAASSVILAGGALLPHAAHAQVFDFEDQTATFISNGIVGRPGAFTSLSLVNSGITLTITRPNGTRFDIVDNTAGFQTGKAPSFGTRSLDPFFETGDNGFIGNFSSAVTNLSVDFGDYTPDDSDTFTLSAFSGINGTGTLLGTTTLALPDLQNESFTSTTAGLSAAGIRSFTIQGTSTNPGDNNSVFIDNIRVNAAASAAPEPGSLALLLGAGSPALAGGLAFRLRRRKA